MKIDHIGNARIVGGVVNKVDHIKNLISMFRDYIKIAEVEKKLLGEVMTPFDELAKPMVDLMDKYDPEFWKNPNHKVLDSSAGIGTFPIICTAKFMNGLKDWQPDVELRFKHIVENCIYYGELQPRNCFLWLCSIDPFDEYKTNTYCGSFLDEGFDKHMKEVWKVDSFDLIIQNPPYQEQKPGFTKTQPLWHLFVQKSLTLLKDGGYLVMVHPSGWRNVDGVFKETQNLLKSKQILELNINSQSKGNDLFGAETRFDFYILKNNLENIKTTIIDEDDNKHSLNIKNMEFIPNGMFEFINSLLSSTNRVSVLGDSSYHTQREYMCKIKSDIYKYPCIYTVAKGDLLKIWYSNRNDNGHFGIPKVIWSNGRVISVGIVIDERGEYGLTQFSYAIVDDLENLKKIKIVMDSKKFRKVMELCSVGVMGINKKVISNLKKDFWKEFI